MKSEQLKEALNAFENHITIRSALLYEIAGSWWAFWLSVPVLQEVAAKYFLWKVKRKHNRYQNYITYRIKTVWKK